ESFGTAGGIGRLAAFALRGIALPKAPPYTRWRPDEPEPRLASSTARGFPPPPISAARGSVWQMPIVAPEESRSRRRMYFALAGFAIGFGAGIGVLVSSSSQRASGGTAAVPRDGSGGSSTRSGPGAGADQPAAHVQAPCSP